MKLSRTPRSHSLLDFRQFTQSGTPSSHFKCRLRHVRHPVRTLLGREGTTVVETPFPVLLDSGFSPGSFTIIVEVSRNFDAAPTAFRRFAGGGLFCEFGLSWLEAGVCWSPSTVPSDMVEVEKGDGCWRCTSMYPASKSREGKCGDGIMVATMTACSGFTDLRFRESGADGYR